ncbi:hypothetical protein Indivirus_9_14 [Indivirus ILV1]|uniref:Uncharacterized protein n=1 Tax=Indivirus ILV1 TaxID=1977633 RepID=A0A1V0SE87_9VIRU|nr:hypothetical protein Indivirus_9_14 [Indivirus ILV1]
MKEFIEYNEHKINVLVSQIELAYNKIIIYHFCYICDEPILITDSKAFGEQCNCCKKWFCNKRHTGHKNYFDSCAYKNLFGCFIIKRNTDSIDGSDSELLCLSCAINYIESLDNSFVCEHLTKSLIEKKLNCNTIVIKNNSFYCEECDAVDNIVIYI